MTKSSSVSSENHDYLYVDDSQEQLRLDAVRRYQLVDQPKQDAYQRIAFVASALFDTPIGSVSLVEQDRVWLAGCQGLTGVDQVGKEPGLCATVITQDDVYVVNNAAEDPRTHQHPLVRGELGLRFYAAAPIRTRDGYRLGTVNAIDARPRETTPRQLQALQHLAEIVADELELRLMVIRSAAAEQRMRETVR